MEHKLSQFVKYENEDAYYVGKEMEIRGINNIMKVNGIEPDSGDAVTKEELQIIIEKLNKRKSKSSMYKLPKEMRDPSWGKPNSKLIKEFLNLKEETILIINDLWENSEFKYLRNMSSDQRGSWGENLIYRLIKLYTKYNVKWDADRNTSNSDGIYDLVVNKHKAEVKTATSGYSSKKNKLTNTYQHENIYEDNVWDKLILLDVNPDGFYITIINHKDMVFGENIHPIFGKKSTKHLSGWKFDTSKVVLERGIQNNLTIYIDMSIPNLIDENKICKFLKENLK